MKRARSLAVLWATLKSTRSGDPTPRGGILPGRADRFLQGSRMSRPMGIRDGCQGIFPESSALSTKPVDNSVEDQDPAYGIMQSDCSFIAMTKK